jgi:type IV secretory pathway TrbL component
MMMMREWEIFSTILPLSLSRIKLHQIKLLTLFSLLLLIYLSSKEEEVNVRGLFTMVSYKSTVIHGLVLWHFLVRGGTSTLSFRVCSSVA